MSRRLLSIGMAALAVALIHPSLGHGFFPPDVPVTKTGTPPDPFKPPTGGGLGEPEPTDPGNGPSIQTPEPATIVTALTGLALAVGLRLRRRANPSNATA